MGRKVALLLFLILSPTVVFGWGAGGSSSTATVSQSSESDLTFWVPFTDPDNPLTLLKGTGPLSFTRATTATYVHPTTGLITSAGTGVLRIESNGALIEGARTNIALQSAVLGTTWAASNITIVDDNTTAPTGDNTAERLTASAGNGTLLQSITGTAAAYTFSIYLKRLTGTGNVDVRADNTTWSTCTINASTWTRCSVTATLTDNTYAPGVRIVTSGDAVYAWGGQMEAGAFYSSYIPTTVAAVARNADELTMPTSGNVSGSLGTAAFEFDYASNTEGGLLGLHTGATSTVANIRASGMEYHDGTNNALTTGALAATQPALVGFGVRWGGALVTGYLDGAKGVDAIFDGAFPVGVTAWIGRTADHLQPWGHIKNLRIWSRALTDAEMVAVTTQ